MYMVPTWEDKHALEAIAAETRLNGELSAFGDNGPLWVHGG